MGELETVGQVFTGGVNQIILWVLALSGLFLVLEAVGLLPTRVSGWINRNRLRETMRLLRELGIDVDTARRVNSVARLEQIPAQPLTERVSKRLETAKINHPVSIGTQIRVASHCYIDLMGATSDLGLAKMYARDLTALWRSLADVGGLANAPVEFVVAPKGGSPLLACCFAELLKKPLLLHNPEAKFESSPEDAKAYFDCNELPQPRSRGLMVDDSSTGGSKALRLVRDLRRFGWEVSDFLVVFEPQLKSSTRQNAAERLKREGVVLHSIVKT